MVDKLTACKDCRYHLELLPINNSCKCSKSSTLYFSYYTGSNEQGGFRYCEDINTDGHCKDFKDRANV